ncbi:TauD/TfdA family dioxygenase [Streptomyces sp. Li-HN-5-11]|uniref:TauD/TfdA family dioxygenase n=1 Tax=Streptomyces sp. Li-HN-5-11 TaxID=3075432 RepID=UPI0028AA4CC1|nr:TauD/TfdA family dioxygenase [Streptomyces sp. Li-HN-5-11]WNM30389.1 TauD/TfdA family dioxygenase [Streptomyces sp. Li-HN-5-11]
MWSEPRHEPGPGPSAVLVRTLGGFEVTVRGRPIERWRGGKSKGLMQLLLLHRDRAVSRDFLQSALWPGACEANNSSSLKVAVHALRRVLEEVQEGTDGDPEGRSAVLRLATSENGYVLQTRQVWADHEEFAALVDPAHTGRQDGTVGGEAHYARADKLYRGDFLPEVLDDWAATHREWLRSRQLHVLNRLVQSRLAVGDHLSVVDLCRRILDLDHLYEAAYRMLITAHAELGLHTQARRWYDLCAQRLRTELQVEPSDRTRLSLELARDGVRRAGPVRIRASVACVGGRPRPASGTATLSSLPNALPGFPHTQGVPAMTITAARPQEVGGTRVLTRTESITVSDHFELRPCGPTIGAEIIGLDLAEPPTGQALADLKRAFLDWKVLFLRDQHLTPRGHVELARCFGDPIVLPVPDKGEFPEITRVAAGVGEPGAENVWHSDGSGDEKPSLGSILHALHIPPLGGDTLWADMAAAYDGLAPELKQRIATLRAVHDPLTIYDGYQTVAAKRDGHAMFPVSEHPVVRVHPETGQKILYVNRFYTTRILGVPEDESAELLSLLCDQAHFPEYQVRFHWTPGAVAIWDNRSTQHYACSDYYPQTRVLERVSIAGDRPKGETRSLRSVTRRRGGQG